MMDELFGHFSWLAGGLGCLEAAWRLPGGCLAGLIILATIQVAGAIYLYENKDRAPSDVCIALDSDDNEVGHSQADHCCADEDYCCGGRRCGEGSDGCGYRFICGEEPPHLDDWDDEGPPAVRFAASPASRRAVSPGGRAIARTGVRFFDVILERVLDG